MSKPQKITIDGTDYVRADQQEPVPTGTRVVLVADRGWIFAGDINLLTEGRIRLSRAVLVQRWEGLGFDGMLKEPGSSKVTLKKLSHVVDLPEDAELFRVPVKDDWGL